jgi:KUP system potassium uptake protein
VRGGNPAEFFVKSVDDSHGSANWANAGSAFYTTLLLFKVMRERWKRPILTEVIISGLLLIVDFAFFAANPMIVVDGGWVPLTFGVIVFMIMTTLALGYTSTATQARVLERTDGALFQMLGGEQIPRIPGAAVFLTRRTEAIPPPIVEHVAQVGALRKIHSLDG